MTISSNRKLRLLFCTAAAVLVAVLWVMDFPAKQTYWTTDKWTVKTEETNPEGGLVAYGPNLNLAPGRYRLEWKVDVENAAEIRLTSNNGGRIEPEKIDLVRDDSWGETWITVLDPLYHFCANVVVPEGQEYEVYSLRLSSQRYKDNIILIALVLGALALLWKWKERGIDPARREFVCTLAVTVLLASIPVFGDTLPNGVDFRFHMGRFVNLSEGLREMQFPLRIGSFSYNGYGALTSVFYPDLMMVPFAALLLCGCSLTFTVQLMVVFTNAFIGAMMYISARRILKNQQAALCAMVLYVTCTFLVTEIFVFMRIGGDLLFGFLPLYFVSLYEVVTGDRTRWPVLALGAVGLTECHVVTTFLTIFFSILIVLLNVRQLLREKERILDIIKAALMTACVCSFSVVPLLQCLLSGEYTGVVEFGFSKAGVPLSTLVHYSKGIGLMLLIAIALYVTYQHRLPILDQMLALSVLSIFLASDFFPWSLVERVTGRWITSIQYPARFLYFPVMMLPFVGGWALGKTLIRIPRQSMVVLLMSALFLIPVYQRIESRPRSIQTGEWATTFLDNPEYQMHGTDLGKMVTRNIELEGKGQIEDYTRVSTGARMRVRAEEDMRVSLPILAFPYYRLTLDGQSIPYEKGENNRVTFTVPKGTEGQLLLRFEEPLLWRVCEGISLAGAILLCALLYGMRKRGAGNRAAG